MSLQVWLPLNGNLNNQGLAKINAVNQGATVADGGKIGKCYKFNPENSGSGTKYINLGIKSGDILKSGQSFSLCAWFKITGDSYGNGAGIIACNQYKENGFALMMRVGTQIGIQMCFGDSEKEWYPITGITRDTWYHVTFTYKQENRLLSLYLNGDFVTSMTEYRDWTIQPTYNILIGKGTQGGWAYTFPGYLNDIRIYDHCLSQKEVSEIAKGLVLHYKLDDREVLLSRYNSIVWNQIIQDNQEQLKTIQSGAAYPSVFSISATGSFRYQLNHKYFRKCVIEILSGEPTFRNGKVLVYQSTIQTGNGATIELINIHDSVWKGSSVWTCTSDRGIDDMRFLSNNANACTLVSCFIMVDLTQMFGTGNEPTAEEFEYMFPMDNYPYDTGTTMNLKKPLPDYSGYGYDGEIFGTLSLDNNTSRYQKCTYFDSNSAIKIGNLSTIIPAGIFTFNCWIRVESLSSKSWATIFGGPSGFEIETKRGSDPVIVAYNWGQVSSGGQSYSLHTWNMVTMTRTKSNTKFYLNGELFHTGSAGSIPSGDYFIGSWRDATSQNYQGYVSDVRIYTTELSGSDIANLYHDSLSINNLQGSHCWEYVEDDTMLESSPVDVKRTGVVKAKRLSEAIVSFYDKETYVEPDGSVWIHLFHHNAPSTNGLFSSTDSFTTKVYKDEHRWFDMSVCDYVNKWELMVKQKSTSTFNEYKGRWIQNVNPMTATYAQTTVDNVTRIITNGYVDITWGGLYLSTGTNSYLVQNDGTDGHWWGAVGANNTYSGGIPGFFGHDTRNLCIDGYMDVYLRIDNLDDITLARLGKEGLISDQLNEI